MLLNIGIVLSDLGQDWLVFLKRKSLIHDVIKCIHLINSNEREKMYGFNITSLGLNKFSASLIT